jgi:hypothetical protein
MTDNKLRCALVFFIDATGTAVPVAQYDHAGQYESHGGEASTLYGARDQKTAEGVAQVIQGNPPGGLADAGTLGGFNVVNSDQHQVVYGADADGLCESH